MPTETRDPPGVRALISAADAVPDALRDPIEGVSLSAYLLVEAARLDALPERAVLSWLGVREAAFARAEERWSERVDDALADESAGFDALYEEVLGRALALWARAVDPLDRDVEAWMTFQRHALDAADPGALAREAGLTPGDELRLARLWRARLSDPALAERALSSFSAPLAPLPRVTVAPIVFPPKLPPKQEAT
jgi:hypothetical protein